METISLAASMVGLARLSVGDNVSLVGVRNSPEMVVTWTDGRGKSTCQWFDKSDALHESAFDDRVLVKVA